MKKIHVLLCSHNGEKYISEQLYSIIEQSHKPDFIHIYDFSSTDNTVEILNGIKDKISNIIINVNHLDFAHGAKDSFLFAISKLISDPSFDNDSVVFLSDQDDVWLRDKIKNQLSDYIDYGLHNEPFFNFHAVTVVDQKLKPMFENMADNFLGNYDKTNCGLRLFLGNYIVGHTMMINFACCNLLSRIQDTSKFLMHDWLIAIICSYFGEFRYLDSCYTLYRQHDSNVVGALRQDKKSFSDRILYCKKLSLQLISFSSLVVNNKFEINGFTNNKFLLFTVLNRFKSVKFGSFVLFVSSLIEAKTLRERCFSLYHFMSIFL